MGLVCSCSGGIRRYLLHWACQMAEDRCGPEVVAGRYHKAPASVDDEYCVSKKIIGIGMSGAVHKGVHRRTGREVAVKALGLSMLGTEAQLSKTAKHFAREIEILMRVDHPHVVKLHDVFETPSDITIVMELLHGGSLHGVAEGRDRFPEGDASPITRQMLLAISYLHEQSIVHRDVKPDNFVFEGPDFGGGLLKLIDFGLSKYWKPEKRITKAAGTLLFQAPEVLEHSYDYRCDLWSLGVIVFYLLMGHLPFPAERPLYAGDDADKRLMRRIRRGAYEIGDRTCWEQLSEDSRDIVISLLRVDPQERPSADAALQHVWLARPAAVSVAAAEAAGWNWRRKRAES